MRGRGGGEGGLGTISSELLLWVSMAGREEGELETQVANLSTPAHPVRRNPNLATKGKSQSLMVSANLVLASQTAEGG